MNSIWVVCNRNTGRPLVFGRTGSATNLAYHSVRRGARNAKKLYDERLHTVPTKIVKFARVEETK